MKDDIYDKFAGSDDDTSEFELTVFKRLFQTDDGQYVLGKILEKCKFMEPCKNEQDMALNNFAKELLATIYWDRDKEGVNVHRIMDFIKNKLKRSKRKNA